MCDYGNVVGKILIEAYLQPSISHRNYWDQVNSRKNLSKFWNDPLCRNKSGPFPQLNVAAYWKRSKSEACPKRLSQILANNIVNGGGVGLRTYWGIAETC